MLGLELDFLSGGYYHCTSTWNRKYTGGNGCYKIYFPVSGQARIMTENEDFTVKGGHACFINGFKLREQSCENSMEVFWVHFVPRSLSLHHCLSQVPHFHTWSFDFIPFPASDFSGIPALFENPSSIENQPSAHAPIDVQCRISAMVLYLISDMLSHCGIRVESGYLAQYNRLRPAIAYMDEAFTQRLDLKCIASRVNLNPAYFLRLFKQSFHVTPFEYIASKRLNLAWQMVTTTDLSILEISERLGYCNQFHFSQVFRKHFGTSPLPLRNRSKAP